LRIKELEDALEQERDLRIRVRTGHLVITRVSDSDLKLDQIPRDRHRGRD